MKVDGVGWKIYIYICFLCIVYMLLCGETVKAEERKVLHEGYCGYLEDRNWDDIDHFNGPNVKFRLYDDGTMVISGHGKMESYLYYEDCCIKYKIEDQMPWYKYRNKIKKLVIEDGITEIGWNNFLECRNLESIQWPSTLERVYTGAFKNCTSLVEVTLPAGVKEWYYAVFKGCIGLKKVTLEEGVQFGEPGGFAYGRKMFQDCTSLETVILPKQLAVIPEEFVLGCPNIKEYNIPGEVVSLGSYPPSLCPEVVSLPKTVKYLTWGAFFGCTNLRELLIPDGLLSINGAIVEGCVNLESLVIPDTVTYIGWQAFMKSGIKSIRLSKSIDTIEPETFLNCTNLREIKIPEGVTKIGNDAFNGCSKLKKAILSSSLEDIGVRAFADCSELKIVKWCKENEQSCLFSDDIFLNCKKLKKFVIPKNTILLGNMFDGCKKIRVIVLCSSETVRRFYFSNQKFSSGITLLVPKGKLEEFKAIISQFETDTYKIRVREMKK